MKKIIKILILSFIICFMIPINVFAATDTYYVQKNDSLWKIAVKYQVGLSEIIKANPQFKNPALIYPGDKVYVPLLDPAVTGMESQVLNLVNKERRSRGLSELKMNWQLSRVARTKSEDMRDSGYFSHTSPTYGTPFEMMKKFNIKYSYAGENIARGQTTAASVMNGWMNSEGHRANILNAKYTEIGIGYCTGKNGPYWTQMFIKP